MISVIIPAHNEEAVITRCLQALLKDAPTHAAEVFVVCNGCTDRTADLARAHGYPVHVIEIPEASKVAALNAGDAAATAFPRCYVDADVAVGWNAVAAVGQALDSGQILAAGPEVHFALERCNWAVRSFYRIWATVPYLREGTIGNGFYALSKEGRRRFSEFPDITADDGYIRSLFSPGERCIVNGASCTVYPPRTVAGLLKIKTRSRYGTLEQQAKYPGAGDGHGASWWGTAREILGQPSLWPGIPIYAGLVLLTRARARWRFLLGIQHVWDRDDSARQEGVV